MYDNDDEECKSLWLVMGIVTAALCFIIFQFSSCSYITEETEPAIPNTVYLMTQESPIEELTYIEPAAPPEPEPVVIAEPLLRPCGLSEDQLRDALYFDLKDYAECFLEAERKTGVNAVFIASVAALESGWGRSPAANAMNNLFGWSYKGEYVVFESPEQSIEVVAQKLKDNYLTEGGKYFNGYTIEAVNVRYNTNGDFWGNEVRSILNSIYERAGVENVITQSANC